MCCGLVPKAYVCCMCVCACVCQIRVSVMAHGNMRIFVVGCVQLCVSFLLLTVDEDVLWTSAESVRIIYAYRHACVHTHIFIRVNFFFDFCDGLCAVVCEFFCC